MARVSAGLLRRIEAMKVLDLEQHWQAMPEALARRLRPRVERIGDGVATCLPASDSLRSNRVIGFGHRGQAREPMLDEMIALYHQAKRRRFSLMLSPGPQVDEIMRWLERRGFARHAGYALFVRSLREPIVPVARADPIRVVRAGRDDRDTALRILHHVFPEPASRRAWSEASMANPGREQFLASLDGRAVGVAALRARDGLAWLGGAATLPRWRRRGVQGALIAARLRRARQLACAWAWSETMEPRPRRPNGSARNLERAGFVVASTKPVYVWEK